jgi:redox-sensitive bicupin YhaK (pirin superfamily)
LQIVRGELRVNDEILNEGDGAAISEESELRLTGAGNNGGEFLFFDLS